MPAPTVLPSWKPAWRRDDAPSPPSRGAGATGLTFFDDQVSAFFRTEASCMLVTAIGVPAYRNKAGASVPGQPTELTGYDRVMVRLARRFDQRR